MQNNSNFHSFLRIGLKPIIFPVPLAIDFLLLLKRILLLDNLPLGCLNEIYISNKPPHPVQNNPLNPPIILGSPNTPQPLDNNINILIHNLLSLFASLSVLHITVIKLQDAHKQKLAIPIIIKIILQ